MQTIGIIGFGAFGKLLAEVISEHAKVLVHDKQIMDTNSDKVVMSDLRTVASAPLIIIATDLAGIEPVCRQLQPQVSSQTIVMDVCSVKEKPQEIMQRVLGSKCRVLATHPLFGPQSVAENNSVQGLKMVVCSPEEEIPSFVKQIFVSRLGVEFISMNATDHDKEMAWVHGLTFFVGKGLVQCEIPRMRIETGYFKHLLRLRDLELQHSEELFYTIERGNPYARTVRETFSRVLEQLEMKIEKGK